MGARVIAVVLLGAAVLSPLAVAWALDGFSAPRPTASLGAAGSKGCGIGFCAAVTDTATPD